MDIGAPGYRVGTFIQGQGDFWKLLRHVSLEADFGDKYSGNTKGVLKEEMVKAFGEREVGPHISAKWQGSKDKAKKGWGDGGRGAGWGLDCEQRRIKLYRKYFLLLQAKCMYVVLEWLKSNASVWKEGKKTEASEKKKKEKIKEKETLR